MNKPKGAAQALASARQQLANNQALAAGSETKDVHNTQEATTASHELSPPMGQEA